MAISEYAGKDITMRRRQKQSECARPKRVGLRSVGPHQRRASARGLLTAYWAWVLHFLLIAGETAFAVQVVRYGLFYPVTIPVEKGSSLWTQLPWSVVAAVIATTGALITLFVNRNLQRQQFDRKDLADQFKDILDRFADTDSPLMRANAAIRLAEMAEQRLPGRPEARVPQSYPFFQRAASQLSAALHMEKERPVRSEIRKALRRMAGFANAEGQELLHLQIVELADANRSARLAFVEALAHYLSPFQQIYADESLPQTLLDDALRPLTPLAPFSSDAGTTLLCLHALALSGECRDTARSRVALREAEGATGWEDRTRVRVSAQADQSEVQRAEALEKLLPIVRDMAKDRLDMFSDIQSSAAVLIDTRDALAFCLNALRWPNVPESPDELVSWERSNGLPLQSCFLVGVDLTQANLPGAELSAALLQGAKLAGARLQKADLSQALLQNTDLAWAALPSAELTEADLRGAVLTGARLENALLYKAMLQEADLSGAWLNGARAQGARFEGAVLHCAHLDEDETGQLSASFARANWWDAVFTDSPETGESDQPLLSLLQKHFPRPTHQQAHPNGDRRDRVAGNTEPRLVQSRETP